MAERAVRAANVALKFIVISLRRQRRKFWVAGLDPRQSLDRPYDAGCRKKTTMDTRFAHHLEAQQHTPELANAVFASGVFRGEPGLRRAGAQLSHKGCQLPLHAATCTPTPPPRWARWATEDFARYRLSRARELSQTAAAAASA
jgi:hypothetical protein